MADFETVRAAKADLVLANLHFAVLFDDSRNAAVSSLETPADGSLFMPATAQSAGIIEKAAGVSLTNEMDSKDIEGYGEAEPVRSIISKRTVQFEAKFLETNKVVLEKYWATTFDSSSLNVSAQGGVTVKAPVLPKNLFYRAYLVATDEVNGQDLYAYYIMPRVKLVSVGNLDSKDDDAVAYTMTFQAYRDPALGFSVLQGWCGPGWRSLVAKTGFVSPAVSITVAPTTKSLTVTAGVGKTQQLVVTGSNGINYTPDCTFSSATPTSVSVSATGLMTGLVVGTAIAVTATYTGAGSTMTAVCTVAVTA